MTLYKIIINHLIEKKEEKTSFENEILNGRLKVLFEQSYDNNKIDSMIYFFNESGLPTTTIKFAQKLIYTYNSNNQKLKLEVYSLDGKKLRIIEYVYENENLTTRILKYPASTSKISYNYDYHINRYEYDTKKNLIEERASSKEKKSKEESFDYHYKYQYDSIGNCIIMEILNVKGKIIAKTEKKYENRNLKETFTWQIFEGEDCYQKDIYEYNENDSLNHLIEIIYNYGSTNDIVGQFLTSYTYEYDDEQRLIEKRELSNSKTITSSCSDFDPKGNWQRKVINNNGNLKIILRKFEYYND
jgi:hypothetical protein